MLPVCAQIITAAAIYASGAAGTELYLLLASAATGFVGLNFIFPLIKVSKKE